MKEKWIIPTKKDAESFPNVEVKFEEGEDYKWWPAVLIDVIEIEKNIRPFMIANKSRWQCCRMKNDFKENEKDFDFPLRA